MSYENPIECRNCDELIYWNKNDPSKRPYDAETEDYHRCSASPYKPTQSSTPKLIQCKNGCGIQIVYDVTEGYYREGSLTGKKHFPCPMFGKQQKEQQQPPKQVRMPDTPPTTITQQQPPPRQLEDLIREQNLILQGIAAQLQKVLDTLEISAKYQRASKDILQEYKDEVIDTIKKPPVSFESGRLVDDDGETDDIYDEISDTDDKTDSGVVGDLGGFKPTDAGSKNVRHDL